MVMFNRNSREGFFLFRYESIRAREKMMVWVENYIKRHALRVTSEERERGIFCLTKKVLHANTPSNF